MRVNKYTDSQTNSTTKTIVNRVSHSQSTTNEKQTYKNKQTHTHSNQTNKKYTVPVNVRHCDPRNSSVSLQSYRKCSTYVMVTATNLRQIQTQQRGQTMERT